MLNNIIKDSRYYGYDIAEAIRGASNETAMIKAEIWTASLINTMSLMKKSKMQEVQIMVSSRDFVAIDALLIEIDKLSSMKELSRNNIQLKEKMSKLKSG